MDHEAIREMVSVLHDSRLTELELRQGDVVLRLRRPPAIRHEQPMAVSVPARVRESPQDTAAPSSLVQAPAAVVTAGLVGIFHALRPPVLVGDIVAEGQMVGHIESMRLINDIPATAGGRVVAVHVEEGQPVEYGQPLFEISGEDE